MKISELQQYMGLPAQSPDFDRYLSAHKITARPVYNEIPIENISDTAGGLALLFRSKLGYQKIWGPVREEGEMIFTSLQAYSAKQNNGFSTYPHALPYGLHFDTTLAQAIALFGAPDLDHESGDSHVYLWDNWQEQGWSIAVCFLEHDRGIAFIDLEPKRLRPLKKRAESGQLPGMQDSASASD
jgi:hypothetical protein